MAAVAFTIYYATTVLGDLLPMEHLGATLALRDGAAVITSVASGPAARAGLSVGDRILAVDGRPLRNTLDWASVLARVHDGHPIAVTVSRDGRVVPALLTFHQLQSGPFETTDRRIVLGTRFAQGVTLAFALLIVARGRGTSAILGFWLLATLAIYSVGLPPRMATVWRALPWPLSVLFFIPSVSKVIVGFILMAFFRGLLRAPASRVVTAAAFAAAGACALWDVAFITALVYQPAWLQTLTRWLPVVVGANLAAIVGTIWSMVRRYRVLGNPVDRRRLRWVLAGSLIGLGAGAPTVAGLWVTANDPTLISDTPPSLQVLYSTFLVMPASFWWAIVQRRLFDIGFVLRRGVQYLFARRALLVITPLTLGAAVVEAARHSDDSLSLLVETHAPYYGVLVVGLLAHHAMRDRWLDALDRRLFRERYNASRLLRDLAVAVKETRDLADACARAAAEIDAALHPAWIAVYGADSSAGPLRLLAGQAMPDDPGSGDAVAETRVSEPGDATSAHIVLVLGTKKSGEPYSSEDRSLLQAVTAGLSAMHVASPAPAAPSPLLAGADGSHALYGAAERVVSGAGVDWSSLEATAPSEASRQVLLELQALERLMRVHGCPDDGESAAPAEGGHVQGRTWGPFEIRERLGHGRFGTVYRGWDPTLERDVAIKMLDVDGVDRSAYLREARNLARIRHWNVVHVYGADIFNGVPGFWMELVHGRTLADVLQVEGALRASELVSLGAAMCDALAAVHHAGLVHQDVKAENVMQEPGGRLVLMDLGAGLQGALRPRWGTPRYMAPELRRGGVASVGSDVYSLGVLLHLAATTTFPDERDTLGYLTAVRPDLPIAFRAAVVRALDAEPVARFADADAFRRCMRERP